MDTICYCHTDLDGKSAGAFVKSVFPDTRVIMVNYGDTWDKELVKDKRVVVVDFSFDNMLDLNEACEDLIWCDHHKTIMDTQKRAWKTSKISGYRSLDYSGCLLAYAYFKGIAISDIKSRLDNGDIPIAVKYINDYDLWKFNEGDNTDAFCTAADALMTGPEDSRFNTFINSPDIDYRTKLLDEFLLKGQALILASKQRVHKIADRQTKFNVKTAKGVAISVSFINSTSDISRLGSHINKELGCDIAAIYEVITEEVNDVKTGEKKIIDKIVVHLRSRTCDVEVLARIFKGGGHVGAASYKMNGAVANVRDMLFARIYNSYERV